MKNKSLPLKVHMSNWTFGLFEMNPPVRVESFSHRLPASNRSFSHEMGLSALSPVLIVVCHRGGRSQGRRRRSSKAEIDMSLKLMGELET